jgi:hypothetical protein
VDLVAVALTLAPVLGAGAAVVLHVAISRRAPRVARPRALALGAGGGLLVVAAVGVAAAAPWDTVAAWALTYVALVYFYVFGFYNLGESARRIRLLIELETAGARGLTLSEILARYNARMIVEARLQRMMAGGQVVARDGRYVLAGRQVLLGAKSLGLLKRIFFGAAETDRPAVTRV